MSGGADIGAALIEERSQVLAALIAHLRDFELAEDVLQDASEKALEVWPRDGVPRSPGAWLLSVSRRLAIDRLRRRQNYGTKLQQVATLATLEREVALAREADPMTEHTQIPDERLRLIFTCCHPALAMEARVALTLRTLGGLSTEEVAAAFLAKDATMAQRLVRAKRKIRDAGIPYRVPERDQMAERLPGVLAVVYLIFNAGWSSVERPEEEGRVSLCREAIRLGRVLVALLPSEPECAGLLALMISTHARLPARLVDGALVPLDEQARAHWDRAAIEEAAGLLGRAFARRMVGPYQIQAAISALHGEAEHADDTDWRQIAALYAELALLTRSPVVEINRAVALAMAGAPIEGLRILDALPEKKLAAYAPFHVARAELLRRSGRREAAAAAYAEALTHIDAARVRAHIEGRRASLVH